ncbi:MAG: hypothetical protein RLZZ324_415, partial [Candidatus Parcubacteria bacterium]
RAAFLKGAYYVGKGGMLLLAPQIHFGDRVSFQPIGLGAMIYQNGNNPMSASWLHRSVDVAVQSALAIRIWEGATLALNVSWFLPNPIDASKGVVDETKNTIDQVKNDVDVLKQNSTTVTNTVNQIKTDVQNNVANTDLASTNATNAANGLSAANNLTGVDGSKIKDESKKTGKAYGDALLQPYVGISLLWTFK